MEFNAVGSKWIFQTTDSNFKRVPTSQIQSCAIRDCNRK
jgi:hypothetical protein